MSETRRSDLAVDLISDALKGWTIDVIVSGSIGAVESVRFIRALRRLGADVVPWLTAGGSRFVTEVAVGWAAGRPVRRDFSGDASHIATHHACIIAPASANILAHCATGLTETPASALVASYLGSNLPVMAVPNMHESLAMSPATLCHVDKLRSMGVHMLASRDEEGKRKFPDPNWLADEVAHLLRRSVWSRPAPKVLISMGTTRGYIDDVRYISNYSSGALGTAITQEFHRQGFETYVVAGPCPILPRNYGHLTKVTTNEEMATHCRSALDQGCEGAVLAASILDFAPESKVSGKIKSASHESLTLHLKRQPKIISNLHPSRNIKVGFKLEADLTEDRAASVAQEYINKYALSLMIVNDLRQVDETHHKAWLFEPDASGRPAKKPECTEGKTALASAIVRHVRTQVEAD